MSQERAEGIDWSSQLFELAGVMLLALGPDGRVVHINRAGEEILGRARNEIVGQDWFETFLPERVRAEVRTVCEKVTNGAAGAPEHPENPVCRADGSERMIVWRKHLVRDAAGRIIASLAAGQDVTEMRRAEAQRQRAGDTSGRYFAGCGATSLPANDSQLRAAAEAQLAATPAETPARPVADLLHKLQVHQIELEMQNEILRKAEISLEESRSRHIDLFEFAPVGYLTLSPESVIDAINLTGARLLGAERNALLHRFFVACIAPEERDRWLAHVQHIQEHGEPASMELAMLRGDGSVFQAQLDCVPQKAMRSGIPEGGVGGTALWVSFSDISARKQIEEALQESEAMGRAILDSVSAQIAVLDRGGFIVAVNEPWRRFALENGIDADKPVSDSEVGRNYLDVCDAGTVHTSDDADASNAGKGIRAVLDGSVPDFTMEYPVQLPDQQRWFSMSVTPLRSGSGGVVVAHTDITERKQAKDAVRRLLSRLQLLGEHLPGFVYQYQLMPDGTSAFPHASPGIEAIYGLSPEDAARDAGGAFAVVHPDDLARIGASIQHSADTLMLWHDSYRVLHPNGRLLWVEGRATPIRQPDGSTLWHGYIQDITERKQVEEALFHSHELMSYVIDHSNSAIAVHDKELKYVYVSQRYLNDFRLKEKDIIGKHHYDVIPDLPKKWRDAHQNALSGITSSADNDCFTREDGTLEWTRWECRPWYEKDGSIGGIIVYTEIITERKQAEARLQQAASVFEHAGEGIAITDTQGTIADVNAAFTRITGYSREQAIGQNPRILTSGRQDRVFYKTMWHGLREKGQWSGELWNRRQDGEVYAALLSISAVRDTNENVQQYVGFFSDITAIKTHQTQLEHLAHYDALTSLPNRVLLADRLQQAMAQARRRKRGLAVAFLDLDGFKAINDQHGHKVGDRLLIAVSERMKSGLREGDTLARIGGDEFVAVLVDLSGIEDSVPMLRRLLAAVSEPVPIGDLTVQISASLGVTFYSQGQDIDADQLQRQADQAMYQAKLAGKNRYHVFDAAQDRNVRGHHESIERIRRALAEHEFRLYYQPKVNMRSGAVVGAEALIRWQHPQKGLLAPAAFLPVVEDHPLAVGIGEWVIDTALTQMEIWRSAGLELPVSVNIDAHHLQQPDFVERLHALLMAHPATRSGDLEIEVLETSTLEDIARVSMVIEACRELGVAFALDDFGTGYSSLTYLKRLAVTVLKIDQSFVRDMLEDPDDLAILEGVIGLAAAFRRTAIAEGVETVEHGEALLQMGCQLAQGYGIAHPMPADQMPAWAAAWRSPPAWANHQQVSPVNLSQLHAEVEHRAWIASMANYLRGECAALPPLNPHKCLFGLWLEAERLTGRGFQPGFIAIDTLHQQVHALADDLCKLRTEGRATEAVTRLGELYILRDALLAQMKALEK